MIMLRLNTLIFVLIGLLYVSAPTAVAWTAEWINLDVKSIIDPPRSGHVAFGLEDKIYVFGGYAEDQSTAERYPTNDLWCFDCNTENPEWTLVKDSSSLQPQPRLAAAAVTCMLDERTTAGLVLGGWDSQIAGTGGVILKDIQAFTTGSLEEGGGAWKELPTDLEEPTSRLCALTLGGPHKGIVFIHNHRCVNHVLLLDAGTNTISKQAVSGTPPSPRGLHACAHLPGTSKVVLFGGAAQSGEMSNEVFVLDTETWIWEKCSSSTKDMDSMPTPRASPCLVAIDENSCILFGGASRSTEVGLHGCNDTWLLQIDENPDQDGSIAKWTPLFQDGSHDAPPGRNAATLIPISTRSRMFGSTTSGPDVQYFLLTGGWYPFRTTHGDNFVLKVFKE